MNNIDIWLLKRPPNEVRASHDICNKKNKMCDSVSVRFLRIWRCLTGKIYKEDKDVWINMKF